MDRVCHLLLVAACLTASVYAQLACSDKLEDNDVVRLRSTIQRLDSNQEFVHKQLLDVQAQLLDVQTKLSGLQTAKGSEQLLETLLQLKQFNVDMVRVDSGRVFLKDFKSKITVGSLHDQNSLVASQSYLHNSDGWCSQKSQPSHWISVDFGEPRRIIAVKTQGRANSNQYVTKYYIEYAKEGDDGINLTGWFETRPGSGQKEFSGNQNDHSVVTHYLGDQNVRTRKVRLYMENWWENYPCMRWDVVFE